MSSNSTFVALLRGINVGGGNKISMKELKICFEGLKYKNVRTYINSGNVIFTHSANSNQKITKEIESCIEKNFGLTIGVVVKSEKEILSICKKIPKEWENNEVQKTDVIFLKDEIDNKKVILDIKTNPKVDNLIYTKGAVIWNLERKNYGKSGMSKFIGTYVYKNMTARNVNTTRKLSLLMKV
jgi:uncharacterized protein (DUF1697 family)